MSYGQQPNPNSGNVPPPPPAPGYSAPAQQGYGAPAQPAYGTPAQPAYGTPAQPAYGAQAQPAYGAQGNQYGYGGGAPGQPGYAGWAGVSAVRPGSVTAGGVLAIIGSIVAILLGLLFLVVSGLGEAEEVLAQAGYPASAFGVLGGIVIVIGILVLVFAIFALKGKWWAAIALTIMGAIYIALAVVSLIQGQSGVLAGVIWIAISVGLLMSGTSRAWFRAQR